MLCFIIQYFPYRSATLLEGESIENIQKHKVPRFLSIQPIKTLSFVVLSTARDDPVMPRHRRASRKRFSELCSP